MAKLSIAVAFLVLAAFAAGQAAAAAEKGHKSSSPAGGATYADWASAITAAKAPAANLTTLLAAVQAAGVLDSLNASTTWTILAPNDKAFRDRLREDLGLTPAALLQPANKDTLVKVLSYHVIPGAAVLSSDLKNGQSVTTALAGAAPLKVQLVSGKKPRFVGATNSASVVVADIKIGKSVVHVINDVLLPKGVGKGTGKANSGTSDKKSSKP